MEPRPPKGARPAPQRQPQQAAPGWEQPAQPNRPAAPPSESGYGSGARYPAPGYSPQQPPADPYGGYGQGGYPPAQDPGYAPRYPAPPGYGQPGYGQQPPPPTDPYGGYSQGGYPPPASGAYPPYPSNEPYPGYTPPQQPGYGQPPQQPPAQPPGRGGGGGWIAPLPDEDLNSTSSPGYGAGYGKGGFSADPRSGQSLGGPNRQTQIIAALAIGGLALMILAIVIGFIVFGGDDDNGNNQAGAGATETALAIAAPQNEEPTPTTESNESTEQTPATTEEAVTDEAPTPTEEVVEPTPTEVVEALLFEGELTSLLPESGDLPAGFAATSDPVRLQRSEVAANLDSANAAAVEDQLREWRFDRHWRQEYVIAEADYDANETSVLFVSMNSFKLTDGAAQALDLFVNAAESLGMVRGETVELGDEAVLLTSESNGRAVVIYVRYGNVLMRMYGYSEQGDPTADVIALTESVLAKFP